LRSPDEARLSGLLAFRELYEWPSQ